MTAAPLVVVGSNIIYTITVTNHGPSATAGIALTNAIPTNTTFISAISSQGAVSTNGGRIICNIGSLPMDGTVAMTVTLRADGVGAVVDFASAFGAAIDPNLLNNQSTPIITAVVPPASDLVLGMTGSANPAALNGLLTYSLQVTNRGPATANPVTLTNTLPPGVADLVVSLPYTLSGSRVICNLGSMGSGEVRNVNITFRPTIAGFHTNLAVVFSPVFDPLKGNNTASVKTLVEAPQFGIARNPDNPNQLSISWPSAAAGYVLQWSTDLINWSDVANPSATTVGGNNVITVDVTAGQSLFFRLRQ
jgi:uncharacterized repeat protein (TIGR01451 family)